MSGGGRLVSIPWWEGVERHLPEGEIMEVTKSYGSLLRYRLRDDMGYRFLPEGVETFDVLPPLGANMHDLTGWRKVSCTERESIFLSGDGFTVSSSLTDLDGEYGEPVVYTEWALGGLPRLRDYRYPDDGNDCAHYATEADR